MIRIKFALLILTLVFLINQNSFCATKKFDKNINTFINLIDYIIVDYHNAVHNGKVINKEEFAEMNEFVDNSIQLFKGFGFSLPEQKKINLTNQLNILKKSIQIKAPTNNIKEVAKLIKIEILGLNLVSLSPDFDYSLKEGKHLYLSNCTVCHNTNGDANTEFAKKSNPRPANLLDAKLMSNVSIFHIYNTIRLGIAGTNMLPFNKFTEKEVWNLAFYVSALRFQNLNNNKELTKLQKSINNALTLEEKSILSEDSLQKILKEKGIYSENSIPAMRMFSPKESSFNIGILAANTNLNEIIDLVQNNLYEQANNKAISVYLSNIEPYEKKLEGIDYQLKLNIEEAMIKLRADLKDKKSINFIKEDLKLIEKLIVNANEKLVNTIYNNWFSFLLSFSLILREGIEALLIIVTIIGVLRKLDSEWAIKWIHYGWTLAISFGILSLFFIDSVKLISAENREIFEALASVFSVVILLYVGLWLHSKSDAKVWKVFVESKISSYLNSKSIIGLFLLSFIVVFREVFESTLFLTTLRLDLDNNSSIYVYFGALSAILTSILISWILIKTSTKIPISKFFQTSSFVIVLLSLVLIGKSVSAFQEAGVLGITSFPINFNFSLLGIYSNYEVMLSQIVLIVLITLLWKKNLAK